MTLFFEDFAVGQRYASGERKLSEDDLRSFAELSGDTQPLHTDPAHAAMPRLGRPVLHGPLGLAVFLGLFHNLDLVAESVVALLDTNWRYLAPVHVGDVLRFEMTIIRCRRTRAGEQGVVDRHVALLNQHGERVQEGTTAILVRARTAGPDPVGRAFGTVAWGEALATRLNTEARFESATASWDGTIGLRCGEDEVHLRVYRGRVLEATRRALHAPTFTVEADELTWTELLVGPDNDFTRRTMKGEFATRGSGYEYLRLTKAVTVLVDAARELAADGAAS